MGGRQVAVGAAVVAMTISLAVTAAGCTSSSGDGESSTLTSVSTSGEVSGDATPPESVIGNTPTQTTPPPAPGEVGGSACGTPHGPYGDASAEPTGTVRVGFHALPDSLNPGTRHANVPENLLPRYLMDGPGLFYYDSEGTLVNNDMFGTCTLDSLDPLTITYRIAPEAAWSDGVPVTAADLLLAWAASSGEYNTGTVTYDDDGAIDTGDDIAFDASSPSSALITEFPTISGDGQAMTVTYSSFDADYPTALDVGMPAHIVAMEVLASDDAATATSSLVSLLRKTHDDPAAASDADRVQLKAVADFWNTGFDTDAMPTATSRAVSHGAYTLTDWQAGGSMTFQANPNYTSGPAPSVKTIRWVNAPDSKAAVESLAASALDIINPDPRRDLTKTLRDKADQGIKALVDASSAYEHVDLVFDNGGPFDPASYDGDEARARAVRLAFLHTIPRQELLDKVIAPLDDDAVLRDSFMLAPGQPDYPDMTAANGSADFADAGTKQGIATAKKLLADAGVTKPVQVRLLYADADPRRASEFDLIAASAKKAGFVVIDGKQANWSALLGSTALYDAALFAWQPQSLGVGLNVPNYQGKNDDLGTDWGANNFGHYRNPAVTKDLTDLVGDTDPDQRFAAMVDAEKHLWADGFGTVLYQLPTVVGYDASAVSGVSLAPVGPTFAWDYWNWQAPS